MLDFNNPDETPLDGAQCSDAPSKISARRRPRLLLLAYFFPPVNASGCVRTWNIAKYLARLGWEITVVTVNPPLWRHADVIEGLEEELKRENISRILTNHHWRLLSPNFLKCWNRHLGWFVGGVCRRIARFLGVDSTIGWIKPAEKACASLDRTNVDVILASGQPFTAFKLAGRLSERLGCPYVLDYRDPWTRNPHDDDAAAPGLVREERNLLDGSAAVTVVSTSWAESLERQHRVGSKLHVITNGYDPEDLAEVKPVKFGHFAIVYAGAFYPPKRVIAPVMQALKKLKSNSEQNTVEHYFHYYGSHKEHVRIEAQRAGVEDRVVCHGQVPRAEALAAVKGAGAVIVITSIANDANQDERGIVTGKIFEAIGLGAPVLLVCPSGSDAEIVLRESGSGRAFCGSDADGIARFIRELMSGGSVKPGNALDYSWPQIANQIDEILQGVMEKHSASSRFLVSKEAGHAP